MKSVSRAWWRVVGIAGLVVACRRNAPAPATAGPALPAPVTAAKDSGIRRQTILLIGTSLTAGYGLDPAEAWPALLQARIDSAGLPFHVSNAGVSGETSSDALHRIDWVVQQGVPRIVVVETGANDGLRGQPPDSVRANLEAIVRHLETLTPRPVIVIAGMEALPNMGKRYADSFREIFPSVAREHHVVYLPFFLAGVAGVDSLNQGDGIHPNPRGSRIVAANVWAGLHPLLDSLAKAH